MDDGEQMLTRPPGEEKWTAEQWKAIKLEGRHLLVTAGAGAGKTMILVKRLLEQVCSAGKPVQLDRLLVLTFTNAAAAEMKNRLAAALEEGLRKDPRSHNLRRQLLLLHKAQISTIHSFCLEVIREYYHLIGLDPALRLLNEEEALILQQDVLEDLLEENYANQELDSPFYRLVESRSSARGDYPLQELILRLYNFAWSHPEPQKWLAEKTAAFIPGERQGLTPWLEILQEACRWELMKIAAMLQRAWETVGQPGGPAPYRVNLEAEISMLEKALQAAHGRWEDLAQAMQEISFASLKPCRGENYDPVLRKQTAHLRNRCKKDLIKLRDQLFTRSTAEQEQELLCLAPLIQALVQMVIEFQRRYLALKGERGMADFNDLEHYALQILRHPHSPPGKPLPSAAALAYRERFVAVLVDEYQDINQLQETILNLVSREEPGNMFMVGDVKQSIYRFRLAEPELFLKKSCLFKSGQLCGEVIPLTHNFRSRVEVVDGVNYLFRQLMDEQMGEVAYDEDAGLRFAAFYPEAEVENISAAAGNPYAMEMLLLTIKDLQATPQPQNTAADWDGEVEANDGDYRAEEEIEAGEGTLTGEAGAAEDDGEWELAALEGKIIARRIRELRGEGEAKPLLIYDKKTGIYRPPAYRDMVILMRSYKNSAPVILEELQRCGIPAYAELSTGYFTATEIEVMLSLLRIIDNAYQDIPLAAVLRSPLLGLDAEELAKIRSAAPRAPYYDALKALASSQTADAGLAGLQEKLRSFLQKLHYWQDMEKQDSLAALIWHIYTESGYYDLVGSMPGGQQRQANLRALYDRARQYEATSFRGLSRFLHFVERLRERGSDLGAARVLGEQEDVVRLLTVHKSKGMEFPVVFVAGLARRFNKQDLGRDFLLHRELGFGPKYIDMELRLAYPTLPWLAVKRRLELELLAEELRILYVALTRAEQKLILVAAVRDLEAKVNRWEQQVRQQETCLPVFERVRAADYLDWLGPALLRHPQAYPLRKTALNEEGLPLCTDEPSAWHVAIQGAASLQKEERALQETAATTALIHLDRVANLEPLNVSTPWAKEVARRLEWRYPYPAAVRSYAKLSVSALQRLQNAGFEGDDGIRIKGLESSVPAVSIGPRLIESDQSQSAMRGSVYHYVLQCLDLKMPLDPISVSDQLAAMVKREQLTAQELALIDPQLITAFFESRLGRRIINAPRVWRELPFTMTIPATQLYAAWQGEEEQVFIQGVIDCLFQEKDGLVLVDYKYGGGNWPTAAAQAEQYRRQLYYYAKAVEKILEEKVKEAYIYFINKQEAVLLEIQNSGDSSQLLRDSEF